MTTNRIPQPNSDGGPSVEIILSRSSYRVGETVVGTIRLVPPTATADPSFSPGDMFSDAYVYVAGWCRLDPRWHRALNSEYTKTFQSPGVHNNVQNRRGVTGSVEIDENCVCFWTTNVINLMDLKERTIGAWEDVKPKPIRGAPSTAEVATPTDEDEQGNQDDSELDFLNGKVSTSQKMTADSIADEKSSVPLEKRQLTFTFRAELPINLPHSTRATSCRYFYAVMVGTRVRLPSTRKQWLRHGAPIQVLSLRPDQAPLIDAENTTAAKRCEYPMGSCAAFAHSAGLPIHVTAAELHQPTGQILVNRRGSSSLGSLVVSSSNFRRNPDAASLVARNLQTMRITDLLGIPCCVLTIMGVSSATPGGRMVLKFDFPTPKQQLKQKQPNGEQNQPWTPCYHVSASLEGQEVARFVDGSQKRSQAYQFDAAHEMVDPECTERICLSLLVPLNAPTTVSTDIVEVSATCSIDITVGTHTTKSSGTIQSNPKYSNLRLVLPCRILNSISEYEMLLSGEDVEEDDDDIQLKLPLDELKLGWHRSGTTGRSAIDDDDFSEEPPLIETEALRNTNDFTHPSSFVTKDIRQDLKILSLRMANECDLVQR